MQFFVVKLFLLVIFLGLNAYFFHASLNVYPTHPSPTSISLSEPCKCSAASRIINRNTVSYSYVTSDLIKILSIIFLWALYLSSDIIYIKVRFINFKSNISVLPKRYATKFLSSHTFQLWLYLYTLLLLFEPFLLLFELDKTVALLFHTLTLW